MVRATPAIRTALRPVVRARPQRAQQVRFRSTESTDSARDKGPVKDFNKTGNTNKPWLYAGVAGLTLGGIYATMMGNPDKAAGAAQKIDQKLDFVAEGKSAPHTPHVGDRK
ncbi:uncharacterized protein B0T23DRAFT_404782 [Neurospora hispaniola]|uniref:Uncharacterized protein n=1 Tax=Neurospora hispaniola TaxID=588809 RepID=A0AAJ0I8J2_9PEZI|nr:hypothetical protein B0T23DRAFT_404782 [Neurospora hispaniola]